MLETPYQIVQYPLGARWTAANCHSQNFKREFFQVLPKNHSIRSSVRARDALRPTTMSSISPMKRSKVWSVYPRYFTNHIFFCFLLLLSQTPTSTGRTGQFGHWFRFRIKILQTHSRSVSTVRSVHVRNLESICCRIPRERVQRVDRYMLEVSYQIFNENPPSTGENWWLVHSSETFFFFKALPKIHSNGLSVCPWWGWNALQFFRIVLWKGWRSVYARDFMQHLFLVARPLEMRLNGDDRSMTRIFFY